MRHATCDMRHATCDMRHATCDMRHQYEACTFDRATNLATTLQAAIECGMELTNFLLVGVVNLWLPLVKAVTCG